MKYYTKIELIKHFEARRQNLNNRKSGYRWCQPINFNDFKLSKQIKEPNKSIGCGERLN